MSNLMNFNASSGKSENLHFVGLLLVKVCNVWAKNTDEKWLMISKTTWGISWIFTQVVESNVNKSCVYNVLAEGM